jgi:hypothetical protein
MKPNRAVTPICLSITGALLAAASILWFWSSTPTPPSAVPGDGRQDAGAAPLLRSRENMKRPAGLRWRDDRAKTARAANIIRPRRRHSEPGVRRERDPRLQADPGFQRLLEIDSARKMALLPADRRDLVQTLEQLRSGPKVERRVLEQALLDPNPEVRLAALDEISLEAEEPPIDLLAPVVAGDPSAEVRLAALEIVVESDAPVADGVIHAALDDPDAGVSEAAADALEARADESP